MRVGSLFSGYGGLDMAVGGDLAWYSEIEPAACTVLEQLHPDVPNIGDITAVDWSQVEPVDVITGGYPCQPFSQAGQRKGKNDERHLWPYVRDAISALRPSLAVLENVRGHVSLGLADVIGDLAGLGYDARWGVVRASDAGAPHNRARLFIVVGDGHLAHTKRGTGGAWSGRSGAQEESAPATRPKQPTSHAATASPKGGNRLATDTDSDGHGQQLHARGMGSVEGQAESGPQQRQRTRRESDSGVDWGQYARAIHRWEPIVGRPAPAPTVQQKDKPRLNPVFVEWMMGLPEGHVTGHGLSAAQELKMLGNGVVPQQAALALRLLGVA